MLCRRASGCYEERHVAVDYVDVSNHVNNYTSADNHTELTAENIIPDIQSRYMCLMCERLCNHVQAILIAIQEFNSRQKEQLVTQERDKTRFKEWVLMASVLDRFFFWIYLVTIVLATAFLFPWSM